MRSFVHFISSTTLILCLLAFCVAKKTVNKLNENSPNSHGSGRAVSLHYKRGLVQYPQISPPHPVRIKDGHTFKIFMSPSPVHSVSHSVFEIYKLKILKWNSLILSWLMFNCCFDPQTGTEIYYFISTFSYFKSCILLLMFLFVLFAITTMMLVVVPQH